MFDSSESSRHSVLKIAGSVALVGSLFVIIVIWMLPTTASSDATINSSPMLQTHDRFCTSFPAPPDFKLLKKAIGGNSHTTRIAYWYSSRLKAAEVQSFYSQEMQRIGWHPIDDPVDGSFAKDAYKMSVSLDCAVCEPEHYILDCSKELN